MKNYNQDLNMFNQKLTFKKSISFLPGEKKLLKSTLTDDLHMVMEIGIHQGYCVLSFVNDRDESIDIPTCFYLSNITDDEEIGGTVAAFSGKQFYVLLYDNSYAFTYAGKTSTLIRAARWFCGGEHVWTNYYTYDKTNYYTYDKDES